MRPNFGLTFKAVPCSTSMPLSNRCHFYNHSTFTMIPGTVFVVYIFKGTHWFMVLKSGSKKFTKTVSEILIYLICRNSCIRQISIYANCPLKWRHCGDTGDWELGYWEIWRTFSKFDIKFNLAEMLTIYRVDVQPLSWYPGMESVLCEGYFFTFSWRFKNCLGFLKAGLFLSNGSEL